MRSPGTSCQGSARLLQAPCRRRQPPPCWPHLGLPTGGGHQGAQVSSAARRGGSAGAPLPAAAPARGRRRTLHSWPPSTARHVHVCSHKTRRGAAAPVAPTVQLVALPGAPQAARELGAGRPLGSNCVITQAAVQRAAAAAAAAATVRRQPRACRAQVCRRAHSSRQRPAARPGQASAHGRRCQARGEQAVQGVPAFQGRPVHRVLPSARRRVRPRTSLSGSWQQLRACECWGSHMGLLQSLSGSRTKITLRTWSGCPSLHCSAGRLDVQLNQQR